MTMSIQRLKNGLHIVYPAFAFLRFGRLGKRIVTVGITGTDGKSSSVAFTAGILRSAGHRVAHYSSVSIHDGLTERRNETKISTPGRMGLHRFLAAAIANGATHAVIEVTSQGMLQHRHRFIGFMLVGVTNVTPEHVEAHGSFERYRESKASLARELLPGSLGLVVSEDALNILRDRLPHGLMMRICGGNGDLRATGIVSTLTRTTLTIVRRNERAVVTASLGGPFAARNILFSAGLATALGASLNDVKEAMRVQAPVPGRCEIVSARPLVIVDYAHTLAALESQLSFVRRKTTGKVIHVFGAAGGGRDRYKRPLLAALSERYADVSIVTEENPFDEREESIAYGIRKGFSDAHEVHTVRKREDAIALAKKLLGPGDALLLTGKGSESVIAGPRRSRRLYTEATYARCLFGTLSSA
ncbi:MAG: UDP-N-acetylmuramoyl-L-alanyl-D-glutamate--2,6-diaminopimelate ligase [Candidatus Parcubacteria bacterium]|jgi:UDP-N-acetylmuramoyl-L-alanyl-D-glutamate--2,6-diaminopimelate ligase|nr:UDP-N-acetylmuramoyl-L-alanyl-D-glutamate--2,6-diaminopimelate ligase [Candidatus Parcubacteria bacterium]